MKLTEEQEVVGVLDKTGNTPNRARRSYFIIVSVMAAMGGAFYLGLHGAGKIAELVADGFLSYALAVMLGYILGHSVDRSNFVSQIKDLITTQKTK